MAPRHLRERGFELGRAQQALERAGSAGVGRVIVVTGEPGIGKTALLDAVRRTALEMGAAVGFGKADEVNQIAPGAPVLLALRTGPAPLLDDAGYRSLAPLHDKPLWLVDQLVELLEVRAREGPVLVALDDMQWSDQLSQFLVRALSSRLVGSPIVWVLAARPSSGTTLAGPDVDHLFDGLPVEQLELRPLSDRAVLDLAAELLGAVPADLPAATFLRVGGNPFLVVQICQTMTSEEAVPGDVGLPFSLATVLQQRISALDAGTVDLVELAAVWGVPLPVAAARRLLVGSISDLMEHVRHAAAAGLLQVSGTSFAFRHDLLRELVHEGLDPDRRAALHAACTRYLMAAGGRAAAAVPHARIAAGLGDRAGAELLRRAARECRSATPLTAASLMQEAFAATSPEHDGWQGLGEECAELLSTAQRGTDVTVVVDTLLARPHSAELEARLQVLATRALWLEGRVDEMERRTSRALAHSGTSKPLRSRLQAAHALALSRLGPMQAATEAAEAALRDGRALDDRPTIALALQALGEAAKNEGRHLAAHQHFRELRILFGPVHLAEEIAALQFIDRFDEAESLLAAAEQKAGADLSTLPSLASARLWQDFKQAKFDTAAADARTLLRIGDELGTRVHRLDAHIVLSTIAAIHGNLADAETYVGRAEEEAGAADSVQVPGLMLGRARIAAARGDTAGGVRILSTLMGSPERQTQTYWPRMIDQARLCAGLAVAAGQRSLAEDAVELAATAALNNPDVDSLEGIALQVRGFVHGDVELLGSAVERLRKAPRPMMLAAALVDHGSALLKGGHRRLGIQQLNAALGVYLPLDAVLAAADVQRSLAAAGAPGRHTPPRRQRPRTGWASLTVAELKVAEHISAGLTNREVARALVVSTNTVATHLRSVFTKLDVQSRVQLANTLHEGRREDPR